MTSIDEATLTAKLGAAGYFMIASTVVQLANKSLFTVYRFQAPLLIALLQMAVIAPVAYLLARPRVDYVTLRAYAPLAAVNVLNLVSGLVGTGGLSVPIFIALRRFALLCTVILEYLMFNKLQDHATYAAIAVMVAGAILAALSDLSFNLVGYLAITGNNMMTALHLILVKESPGTLSTNGVLFYNAALSLPLLAVAVALSHEPRLIRQYPLQSDTGFRLIFASSVGLGLTINHSTFLCTRLNEPLVTSVAGIVKNIIMTVIGALLFGDFMYSELSAAGLVVSMAGAVVYAVNSAVKAKRDTATSALQPKPIVAHDIGAGDDLSTTASEAHRHGVSTDKPRHPGLPRMACLQSLRREPLGQPLPVFATRDSQAGMQASGQCHREHQKP